MRTAFLLAIVLLPIWTNHCLAPDSVAPKPISPAARDQFRSIKCFAFGGIGPLGEMSVEERAFHTILESSNALQFFRTTITNSTIEASLYALCGIRQLAPESFKQYALSINDTNQKVTTMEGCFLTHERASNVVARIEQGCYDRFFAPERL
jgi:hypothetical protein